MQTRLVELSESIKGARRRSSEKERSGSRGFGGKGVAREMLLSLYIVNKSGGLIYHRDFSTLAKLDTNDTLRLGSIW